MKKVLLPMDCSATSENVFLYASAFTKEYSAHLHLLYVMDTQEYPQKTEGKLNLNLQHNIAEKFRRQVESNKSYLDNNFSYEFINGKFIPTIAWYMQNNEFDYLILAFNTNGLYTDFYFEKEKLKLNHTPQIPVIVVPEQAEFNAESNVAFNVYIEDSECDLLRKIATNLNNKERLLHCVYVADSQKSFNEAVKKKDRWLELIDKVNVSLDIIISKNIVSGLQRMITKYNINVLGILWTNTEDIHALLKLKIEKLAEQSPTSVYACICNYEY